MPAHHRPECKKSDRGVSRTSDSEAVDFYGMLELSELHSPRSNTDMRGLVTGHLGYIGTVMVPMLLSAGHEVEGVDSDPSSDPLSDLNPETTYAGLRLEDCEGPRFKRIDHLKHLLATGRLDRTLRWAEGAAPPRQGAA